MHLGIRLRQCAQNALLLGRQENRFEEPLHQRTHPKLCITDYISLTFPYIHASHVFNSLNWTLPDNFRRQARKDLIAFDVDDKNHELIILSIACFESFQVKYISIVLHQTGHIWCVPLLHILHLEIIH